MTPERWRHIKRVFEATVEVEPNARQAFLAQLCGHDEALRNEVETMLASDASTGSLLENPVAEVATQLLEKRDAKTLIGQRIGPHRIVREIGRGGMGAVYYARREDGEYDEEVAIKLIKQGMDSDAIIRRFRQERQILASLTHPNIAKLLDGGVTEGGLPYFVMEYIEGLPIDTYCQAQRLPTEQRLELFRTVCGAVHAAHRSLVVHCDLKPSNILITADGVVKLVDFGIARLLDAEHGTRHLTTPGLRLLTPEYSSPEQLLGQPITTASDTWSLAVVLYKLLTGRLPYPLGAETTSELKRWICEIAPPKPSSIIDQPGPLNTLGKKVSSKNGSGPDGLGLSRLPWNRDRSVDQRRRELAGDLDTIILKAIRKEPERRYGSVEQFSEDIRRHLSGLPVIARRATLRYRATKFARRHWMGVSAAALVAVSLLAGIVVSAWHMQVARDEKTKTQNMLEIMVELFTGADPEDGLITREKLDEMARKIPLELSGDPHAQAILMTTIGVADRRLGRHDKAAPLLAEALRLRQQAHPSDPQHPDIAHSQFQLGILRFQQGLIREAERLLRASLESRRQILGPNSREVAESLDSLAMALHASGSFEEAESLFHQALDLWRELLGTDDKLEVTTTMNNLGVLLSDMGEEKEAERLLRKALTLRRRLWSVEHPRLGEEHPEIARTLNNLGTALRKQGRFTDAENVYREAIAMQRKVLGQGHPHLANTLGNLANALQGQSRLEEAESLYREAIAILGEEHPTYADTLSNLAVLLFTRQDLAQAEPLFRQVVDVKRQHLGPEHPTLADNLTNLAIALRGRDAHQEAKALYLEALALHRRWPHEDFANVARALDELGRLLQQLGEDAEAEAYLRESLDLRREYQAPMALIAHSRNLLGASLTALQCYEEAEGELLAAHTDLHSELGEEARRTQLAVQHLIELYEDWKRPAKAAIYRQQLVSP